MASDTRNSPPKRSKTPWPLMLKDSSNRHCAKSDETSTVDSRCVDCSSKETLGRPRGGSNGPSILKGASEGDLGFGKAATAFNRPIYGHISLDGCGIQRIIVGKQQSSSPSQRSTVGKDVSVAQGVVGGRISINGRVINGLSYEQVDTVPSEETPSILMLWLKGMRFWWPTANVKKGQSASTLG